MKNNYKDLINLMRFIAEYCSDDSSKAELFDLASTVTENSDFDYSVIYQGFAYFIEVKVWNNKEFCYFSINALLWDESDKEEFCRVFDIPYTESTDDFIELAETIAKGEF